MGHISPGYAVNARQARQRRRGKLGKAGVITAWYAFTDLLQLRFDEVKVVQQPFGSRRDVLPAVRRHRHIVIGVAQGSKILVHARKKGGATPRMFVPLDGLGLGQAAAVLFKAVNAEQFGAYGRFGFRALRQQDVPRVGG